MKVHTVTLLLAFLAISCGQATDKSQTTETPAIEEKEPLVIVDKGIKAFPVDDTANFEGLEQNQIREINGLIYFLYFDRASSAFYIHNYKTGALIKKVQLAKEGPDAVNILIAEFYLHSLDSIYINTNFTGYYLINGKGKVLTKSGNGKPDFNSTRMKLQIDASSTVTENGIVGTIRGHHKKTTEHFPYLRGVLNIETGEVSPLSLRANAIFDDYDQIINFLTQNKGKLFVSFQRYITKHKNYLYATTSIDDSIRVFKNEQLIKSIYMGIPELEIMDYLTYLKNFEIIQKKGEVDSKPFYNQPPLYGKMDISPDGNYIYRVITHGTRPAINPDSGLEFADLKGATLLILDIDKGERYTYELPADELNLSRSLIGRPFVSNEGIHFYIKDQEDENQVQYRVFGMDNVH